LISRYPILGKIRNPSGRLFDVWPATALNGGWRRQTGLPPRSVVAG
jgi:hypothetical protein